MATHPVLSCKQPQQVLVMLLEVEVMVVVVEVTSIITYINI